MLIVKLDQIDGYKKVSQWIPDSRWVKIPKKAKLNKNDIMITLISLFSS